MKLTAKIVPASGIVGGGVALYDQSGASRYLISVIGTTAGPRPVNWKKDVAARVAELIQEHGLEVPDAEPVSEPKEDGLPT